MRGEVWGGVGKGGYQPKLRIPNNRVKSAVRGYYRGGAKSKKSIFF